MVRATFDFNSLSSVFILFITIIILLLLIMGGFFKVLGFLVGSSAAGGSVYYWSRDEGEKRRVRVQLGGVTRFLRCIS